jgi:hypothetical protein
MTRKLIVAALAVFLFAGSVSAQNIATKYVSGEQVKTRTEVVMTKIPWVNDLDKLKTKAQKENKLIFWMQIVGSLDGGL